MTKSLLDLLPEADKKKAIERGKKRMERQNAKKGLDVSPEMYLVSEYGYYLGRDGIVDIRNGYIERLGDYKKCENCGGCHREIIQEPFTLDEVLILLEGLRKVWYSKLTEQGHASLIANSSVYNKNPGQAFNNGVKPFTDRAEVRE